MLANGEIAESVIRIEDLSKASTIWFINSVRGMLAVRVGNSESTEGCEHVN